MYSVTVIVFITELCNSPVVAVLCLPVDNCSNSLTVVIVTMVNAGV